MNHFNYIFYKIFITKYLKNDLNIGDWGLGIGDWGLGIGDWAQSPIPNPQSPIPNPQLDFYFHIMFKIKKLIIILLCKLINKNIN